MNDLITLVGACLASFAAGAWWAGGRWQRAWIEREKRAQKAADPYERKAEQ